jgi:hypothetical protein
MPPLTNLWRQSTRARGLLRGFHLQRARHRRNHAAPGRAIRFKRRMPAGRRRHGRTLACPAAPPPHAVPSGSGGNWGWFSPELRLGLALRAHPRALGGIVAAELALADYVQVGLAP